MSSEPSGTSAKPGLAETGTSSGQPHGLRANALKAGDVVILSLASSGYQRLNAWQPSAGATYSWVGRA
jgi:hypothetical protein